MSYSLMAITTLVIIVASLKTAAFGYYQGFTFELAILMGALLILIDWFKVALGERVRWLWFHRQYVRGSLALSGLIVLMTWSFATTVGVYSLTRYETAGTKETSQRKFDLAQAEMKRLQDATSTPRPRTVAAIEADLTSTYSKRVNGKTVQEQVGDCSLIVDYVQRTHCPEITRLKGEIASAQAWFDAERQLAEVRKSSAATDKPPSSDIQAEVFSKLTGLEVETVKIALVIALALIVEFVTGFGYILAGQKFERKQVVVEQPAREVVVAMPAPAPEPIQEIEPEPVAPPKPASPAEPETRAFVKRLRKRRRRNKKGQPPQRQPANGNGGKLLFVPSSRQRR